MNRYAAVLILLLAAFVFVASRNITAPFVRHWENLSACNAQFARNQNRFGIGVTRGAALSVFGDRLENYPDYRTQFYCRHPFVPQVLGLSLTFRILGEREWAFRGCLLVVSVLTLLLFHALSRRLLGEGWALVADAIFAFNPLFAYFSQVVPELAFTLLFVLASLVSYLRWLESGRRLDLAAMVLASFGACWSDWFGYGAALVVFFHLVFVERKRRAIGFAVLAAHLLFFVSYVAYVFALEPRHGTVLRELFQRGNTAVAGIEGFGAWKYLAREGRELAVYFTPVTLVLNAIWLVRFARRRTREEWFVVLLLSLGVYEFVFFDLAYVHDFYTYTLLPLLSIGAVLGLRALGRWKRAAGVVAVVAILVPSGFVLWNRLTKVAAYEVSHQLGEAIRESTAPGDRVLAVAQPIHQYVMGFYADRHVHSYSPAQRVLYHGMGPKDIVTDLTPDRFVELARREYEWVALSTRPFAGFPSDHLQIQRPDSELVRRLEVASVSRRECRGFVLYRLR